MDDVLLACIVVVAGFLGIVVGSVLGVVVYRVPTGAPFSRASRCLNCHTRVRWLQSVPIASWIARRGRCADCHAPISPRYPMVEVVTGLSFAGIAWLFLASAPVGGASTGSIASMVLVMIAYLYLGAASIALTLIDLDTHRLPNSIVLPGYLVGLALFTSASLFGADWGNLVRAVIGMAALFSFYLILRLVRPDGMGGGDVKLAGVLGLYLGWLGWTTLTVGVFAAFVLGGVFGAILMAVGRAGRRTAIPFGPWMLAGAWMGILLGEVVGRL